jgi:hypothetical protein
MDYNAVVYGDPKNKQYGECFELEMHSALITKSVATLRCPKTIKNPRGGRVVGGQQKDQRDQLLGPCVQ